MPREPANFEPHPGYAELDNGVQEAITEKQFSWLPDVERTRFLNSIGEAETYPDS